LVQDARYLYGMIHYGYKEKMLDLGDENKNLKKVDKH
jgi:hypothetical protein